MDPLARFSPTPEILRLVAEIDEFKGRWQALGRLAPDRLTALRRVATIESIGSSTRIEGAKLSDREVEDLLSRLELRSFRSRDEEEVAGYADAMEAIFDSHHAIRLTENYLKQLHGMLLRHSEKDAWHRGEYKKHPSHLEAFAPDGKSLGVIFVTTPPFETPRRMEELVAWMAAAQAEREHHPLLVIAVFVVRFLAIHPFQDGNGRLSRIFTTLLLLRAGYDYVPYASLERVVEENKDHYYRALRRAQSTLDQDEAGLGGWITFFLRTLAAQKDALIRKVNLEQTAASLPELSMKILTVVRDRGRITMSEAIRITGASRNTIKVHLRRLVADGYLAQRGQGRGTWYENA